MRTGGEVGMRLIDVDALADALFEKRKNYPQWVADTIGNMPDAVVRCRDCKWWDKKDGSNYGYCHACKHGYYSDHWEIGIYRTYKGDWFCADGERK